MILLPEHEGRCNAAGWCSGEEYSGPAREAMVLLDGNVAATGVANISKHVAGLHGLSIAFDCAVFASGNHTASVGCKCINSDEIQVFVAARFARAVHLRAWCPAPAPRRTRCRTFHTRIRWNDNETACWRF